MVKYPFISYLLMTKICKPFTLLGATMVWWSQQGNKYGCTRVHINACDWSVLWFPVFWLVENVSFAGLHRDLGGVTSQTWRNSMNSNAFTQVENVSSCLLSELVSVKLLWDLHVFNTAVWLVRKVEKGAKMASRFQVADDGDDERGKKDKKLT